MGLGSKDETLAKNSLGVLRVVVVRPPENTSKRSRTLGRISLVDITRVDGNECKVLTGGNDHFI